MKLDLDLDAIEQRAKAATPGPWSPCDFRGASSNPTVRDVSVSCTWPDYIGVCSMENGITATSDEAVANAAHIAGMDPPTVLALVARARNAERLEAQRDQDHKEHSATLDKWIRDHFARECAEERAEAAEAEAARLKADVEKLRAGLRPFGDPIYPHRDEPDHWPAFGKRAGEGWPTVGHVRTAARLLAETAPSEQEGSPR